ncbi:MAG: DUF2199 domain-containing protein [Thalassovita sp.]
MRVGPDLFDANLCRHGDFRFITALIKVPIAGSAAYFSFEVCVSLKVENFDALLRAAAVGGLDAVEPMFCWVSYALPYFDTANALPAEVSRFSHGIRPSVTLDPACGPVALAQNQGQSFDQLLDLYAPAASRCAPIWAWPDAIATQPYSNASLLSCFNWARLQWALGATRHGSCLGPVSVSGVTSICLRAANRGSMPKPDGKPPKSTNCPWATPA